MEPTQAQVHWLPDPESCTSGGPTSPRVCGGNDADHLPLLPLPLGAKDRKLSMVNVSRLKEMVAWQKKAKKKKKPILRLRKNLVLLASSFTLLSAIPRRLSQGPLYPSFNWSTELGYRAVVKVTDHHYLLSWDDLRHIYPITKKFPKSGIYHPVEIGDDIRGEFLCYSPEAKHDAKNQERKKEGGQEWAEGKMTIFFIHGGGFCMHHIEGYREWGVKMSKLLGGMQFFLVDYDLSPEHHFPRALYQCWKTYLWITDQQGGGIPAERLVVAGDSAGANLALGLLFLIRQARLEKVSRDIKCEQGGSFRYAELALPHPMSEPEQWSLRENQRRGTDMRERYGKKLPHYEPGGDEKEEVKRRRDYRRQLEKVRSSWLRRMTKDKNFMRRHRMPFELDENEKELLPHYPLCAMLLSPWVDLSEHSSAFRFSSYPKPEKFRPYHIGLRFVHAYLDLQPSDYPFTLKKNRELSKAFRRGTRAQIQETKSRCEKDRARIKTVRLRGQLNYINKIMRDELRVRQVDKTRSDMKHSARRLRACPRKATVSSSSCASGDSEQLEEEEALAREINRSSIYSPYISPIYGDLVGLPPMLITGGDEEPLWGDIQKLVHKGREQGLEVDLMAGHQMNHDFQFFFQTVAHPEVNRFLTQAKDWIRLQLQILGDEGEMARLKRKEESISQYHQKHSGHCEIKRLEKAASMVTSPVEHADHLNQG